MNNDSHNKSSNIIRGKSSGGMRGNFATTIHSSSEYIGNVNSAALVS